MRNLTAFDPSASPTPFALPRWIKAAPVKTSEDLAFAAGAALSHLEGALTQVPVPMGVLRDRLCFDAAAHVMGLIGRIERVAELRDVLHLAKPGDALGPAGEICEMFRQAAVQPFTMPRLARALPGYEAEEIAEILDQGQGAPVTQAALVLAHALGAHPKDEAGALILADVALARGLGWTRLMPVLGLRLPRRALRMDGAELSRACFEAVLRAVPEILRHASDLTKAAARLHTVAPKLRAKTSDAAVQMILECDGITAARLSDRVLGVGLSDRAARRLCDRLVGLGALRELSGRDTFRIYGL